MEKYTAVLAVFSNIENVEYIKTVLAEVKDFVKDMQDVTVKDLLDARKIDPDFPKSPLIRSKYLKTLNSQGIHHSVFAIGKMSI